MKLLYIKWIDAVAPTCSVWMGKSEVEEHLGAEMVVEEVGFVVDDKDKDYISLVAGYSCELDESEFEPIYHRLIRIPRVCIRKKIDLTRHIR